MKTITASERKTLIRLASTLPVGDDTRKAILTGLAQTREAGPYKPRPPWPEDPGGAGKPGKKNVYNLHNEYNSLGYGTTNGEYSKADKAEYMEDWREKWEGKHKDRTQKSPDGYGGSFKPPKSDPPK